MKMTGAPMRSAPATKPQELPNSAANDPLSLSNLLEVSLSAVQERAILDITYAHAPAAPADWRPL